MSYKSLTTPTMVTISGAWLDNAQERPLIESLPKAGALLSSLEVAHTGILTTQNTGIQAAASIIAIQEQQGTLDVLHDRKARGGYNLLGALAELATGPEEAAKYLALRDRLYPHGLKIVQWSYTDEAGEAKLAEERLSDDDKILLKKIPVPNGSLFDEHQARIKAAKDLGELEKKKTSLASSTETQGTTPSDVVRARNHWIRVVSAFVKVLELEDLSDADEGRILNQLRDAERRADQRTSKTEGKAARHSETAKPSNTSTDPTGSAVG